MKLNLVVAIITVKFPSRGSADKAGNREIVFRVSESPILVKNVTFPET